MTKLIVTTGSAEQPLSCAATGSVITSKSLSYLFLDAIRLEPWLYLLTVSMQHFQRGFKSYRHTSQDLNLHTWPESCSGSPPQRIMAATNKARSLSSSSRALNLTANSNFGSMISLKGFRKLRRNSRVTKPLPLATNSPSLFMRDGSMAKIASCTPYFNKVTCSKHTNSCLFVLS